MKLSESELKERMKRDKLLNELIALKEKIEAEEAVEKDVKEVLDEKRICSLNGP